MKQKLVALVGLVLVSGLLLLPVAPCWASVLAIDPNLASPVLLRGTMTGWDWGGSGGS
ncbi:MAG: hypothetical protein PVH41_02845 [Anaerolineae bacterium]|jgi:hypothetical protein